MNSQILSKINNFVKNRLIEFSGFAIILFSSFLLLSVATYSPNDPNFIYTPENTEIKNIGKVINIRNIDTPIGIITGHQLLLPKLLQLSGKTILNAKEFLERNNDFIDATLV